MTIVCEHSSMRCAHFITHGRMSYDMHTHMLTAHALHCSGRSTLRTQEHAKWHRQPHAACERHHGARDMAAAPPAHFHVAVQADATQQHATVTQARARAQASTYRRSTVRDLHVLERALLVVDVAQVVVQLRMGKHESSQRRAR